MATGNFCWFDLMSTEVGAAKAFYTALFGWEVRDHNVQYSMIHDHAGRSLGGMMASAPGQPSAWLPYVSVDDIEVAVAAVKAGGGKVFMQHEAAGVGKFAIFADPQGGVIAAIQLTGTFGPYPREKNENHLCWSELHCPDPAAAAEFYKSVFGWNYEAWGPDYLLITNEHAGGIMRAQPGVPTHWLVYANTQSTDGVVARVGELGGKTLMPAMDMPDVGRFAVFADPAGAVFAVMQSVPRG